MKQESLVTPELCNIVEVLSRLFYRLIKLIEIAFYLFVDILINPEIAVPCILVMQRNTGEAVS
jgi:hypothetical protein